jgi:hypothetical protein
MSNTDDFAEKQAIEQKEPPLITKPLYRQFTSPLVAILLTTIVTVILICTFFYHKNEQSRLFFGNELAQVKQQFEQLKALKRVEYLVNELLFTDSGRNVVELQTELIAVNKQLISLESSYTQLYQQWLDINESANDTAIRIQKNYGRNDYLKQSSIIQLQLIWFSVTPIINNNIIQQELLLKQVKSNPTRSRTNAYINSIQQLNILKELKQLSAEVLTRFEALTIHTSMDDFDLLRLGVENITSQSDLLMIDNESDTMIDFSQQIETFEKITLTQQNMLAKWHSYIRLAQKYQLDLVKQRNALMQILAKPQERKITNSKGGIADELSNLLNYGLMKINVKTTINILPETLSIILLLMICLSLFVFCFLLFRLRNQIKLTTQQSFALIKNSLSVEKNSNNIQANCAETDEIIQQLQAIAMPAHNEKEFQALVQDCLDNQAVIEAQAQEIVKYTQNINQQQSETSEQLTYRLTRELQQYKFLEFKLLLLLQQQTSLINKSIINPVDSGSQLAALMSVYHKLQQFYLVSEIQSESMRLILIDVNLVEQIHSILLNKQREQLKFNNQLYFSYDENLLINAKLDFRLFQQLLTLLIDIALQDFDNTQLHLHLQLKDQNVGQQLVCFVVTVKAETIETLPDLVTLLVDSQTTVSQKTPLIDMFNGLMTKQYGENLIAQLVGGGFQLSFELPLAIVSLPVSKEQQVNRLESTNIVMLSANEMLAKLVGQFIDSTWAQFGVIIHLDDFNQQFSEKRLSKQKVDLLIVASNITQKNIELITQQLNDLPTYLRPKLMVLQSTGLSFDDFGFYSQSEQLLFKEVFLQNIAELLMGEAVTNQLLTPEQCQQKQYLASELPVILAVSSPQKNQNFQRLLCLLGLQVHVVSHAEAQKELWETGLYCILFTEFPNTSLLKMTSKPLVDVAVFSLTEEIPNSEKNTYFDDWHLGQLVAQPTLDELSTILAPWLQCAKTLTSSESMDLKSSEQLIEDVNEEIIEDSYDEINEKHDQDNDELVITELAEPLTEDSIEAVFDFSRYVDNQGSVELALFMLDEYGQDNHQQLDILIYEIKDKDFNKAKEAIIQLQFNAKILAAAELTKLCSQWLKLFNGNDIPSSLNDVNILLKETRAALMAIDNYAEKI